MRCWPCRWPRPTPPRPCEGVPLYRHLNDVFRQIDPAAPQPRMPLPMVNMISGGLHAGGNLDFQDFLIMPHGRK